MAVLGLRFCARAFSSCGKRGPLFIAVRGPLTIKASLVAEHRLQTRRLSSCGSRAQSLRGMWDPPGPGLEPVSPALAGGFSTTAPPGKPSSPIFKDRNTRQTKHKRHTQMLASRETNELLHRSGTSLATHSSLQQGTPLKYKANWLILEKKSPKQRK